MRISSFRKNTERLAKTIILSLFLAILATGITPLQAEKDHPPLPCILSGTNPVIYGNTYTFTLSGSCSAIDWSTDCGTIQSSTSTSVTIFFNQIGCSSATITAIGTSASKTVTVSQPPALVGGTISNPTQATINYNWGPYQINASAATGGSCSGGYTYLWYSSTDNITFYPIATATGQNYQPGALTVNTWFKRLTTCNTQNSYTTNTAQVTVYPLTVAGTISPSSQSINYNTVPGTLTASAPSGGNGSYTFQWCAMAFGEVTWTAISGATSSSYSPGYLTNGCSYLQLVNSNGAIVGNTAVVYVYPQLQPGSVSPASQSINNNTVPATLSSTGVSGGNGAYTYRWANSSGLTGFGVIPGATASTYTPPPLTVTEYYQVEVTSNGVITYSVPGGVTVYPQLWSGTISPASQTIHYNTSPASLSVSGTTGGNGSYTYQWQSCSSINGTYSPISGAGGNTYTPQPLTSTTYYEVVTTSNAVSVTSNPVQVIVNPALFSGTITPASVTIPTGTSPGTIVCNPSSGGACSGSYSYQWQSSPDNSAWSDISGATNLSYGTGNLSTAAYYRLRTICGTDTTYSASSQVIIGTATAVLNYIRIRTLSKPNITDTTAAGLLTSPVDVQQMTTYFDGIGRPIQSVERQGSPLQHDIVSVNMYDPFGREPVKYIPYAASASDGNFKPYALVDQNAFNTAQFPGEQYYFQNQNFEASPLSRILNANPAGISWAGSNRGTTLQSMVNTSADSVQVWTIATPARSIPVSAGVYAPGQLYKNVSADEASHQVIEYKDMLGHVVLKKIQLSGTPGSAHVGWLNTYYVYDYLNNLRFVMQPTAVEWLLAHSWNFSLTGGSNIANELCFRYEYDYRNRMIIKKVPGAGEVWMVYDARDRLAMTQDSALRIQHKWMFTRYDNQNRPDSSGLITDPTNYNNLAYHLVQAASSIYYPNPASYSNELLTQTYYDNYDWISIAAPSLGSSMATTYTSSSTYFITGYNTSPTYAVPITPFPVTRGMPTGSMTKVIGTTSQYLYAVNFYDDQGRVIQSKSINYTGGIDTATTQYDFSGKPLRSLLNHRKNGTAPNTVQTHAVLTKMNYDPAFRLKSIWKNIDGAASDQLIDSMQYNELGQLRVKYLGNNIDSLVYDYNIRGWLTGINKNYVGGTASHYFGMELGYDKTSSIASTTSYAQAAYNGNIAGTIWKSAGDGIGRKYDFTYDNVNRLNGAAFVQNSSGSAWDNSFLDFSVSNLSYDANGNILSMNQNGFKVGGSGAIDQLTYTYQSSSNKLSQVTDAVNDQNTKLGDFHYNPTTKAATDYSYDGNGNMNTDNNKAIDQLSYNYLNLPQQVHMNGKGNIVYTYDAGGNKLKKVTADSTSLHSTTTLYLGGFVYQQTDTLTNPGGGVDTLQFMAHEEGRARWAFHKYTTGYSAYKFEYDFFEKDHLGNTRMLLTQQKDTTNYLASMETAYRANESQLFANIAATAYPRASVPGYPSDLTVTNPNDNVAKVDYNGSTGQKTGPSLLLKVMSGDTVKMGVQSYYNSGSGTTNNSSFSDVLNSLAGGLVNVTSGAHGLVSNLTAGSSSVYTGLTSFLGANETTVTGYPKAYLNWIFLDNQFSYVSSLSGSVQAASSIHPAGTLNTIAPGSPLLLNKSGYLYIWVSNETQGWDVFFDNLSVQHRQGPVLEENHYYPFGLTMAGISDRALKTGYAENKYRYNKGSELQNKEFSDGSGLELYETPLRSLDPQLGRWWQVDPKIDQGYENVSPYSAMNDDPARYNDPKGEEGEEGATACCKTAQEVWGFIGQTDQAIIQAGGGERNVVTDAVAVGWTAIGTIVSVGALVYDLWKDNHTIPAPVASPLTPPAQSSANATSNQGSGQGRGSNNRKPDKNATGDHTVSDSKGSTTYKKNDRNPSGFQEVKRTDTKGKAHNGVPTPHTHEGGKVTPAKPEDIPKTDLNKNVPPPPPPPTNLPPQNP
ncbi:MAG TPA: DUF6443 domain-containing protein [Puia sp.]|nr:DUF6443 domain-containing protein [Puia sp.]